MHAQTNHTGRNDPSDHPSRVRMRQSKPPGVRPRHTAAPAGKEPPVAEQLPSNLPPRSGKKPRPDGRQRPGQALPSWLTAGTPETGCSDKCRRTPYGPVPQRTPDRAPNRVRQARRRSAKSSRSHHATSGRMSAAPKTAFRPPQGDIPFIAEKLRATNVAIGGACSPDIPKRGCVKTPILKNYPCYSLL